MEFSKCKWCGKQLDARNGDECYQCFVTRLEVERNPEIARKVLAHLTQDAPDRLWRPQVYDTGHPDPMFIVKESSTNGGG